MKTNYFIFLDQSGSMQGKKDETILSINNFILDQTKSLNSINQKGTISLITFSSHESILYDKIDLNDYKEINEDNYKCYGYTALLDTLGNYFYKTNFDTNDNNIVIIVTDGLENASKKYKKSEIETKINLLKEINVQFLYIGVELDSFSDATSLSINTNNTINFTKNNLEHSFGMVSNYISDELKMAHYKCSTKLNLDLKNGTTI